MKSQFSKMDKNKNLKNICLVGVGISLVQLKEYLTSTLYKKILSSKIDNLSILSVIRNNNKSTYNNDEYIYIPVTIHKTYWM